MDANAARVYIDTNSWHSSAKCASRISNVPMAHLNVCAIGSREQPAEAKKTLLSVWLPITSYIRLQIVPFDYWERSTEAETPIPLLCLLGGYNESRFPIVLRMPSGGEVRLTPWTRCRRISQRELLVADQDCFESAGPSRWIGIRKSLSVKIRGFLYYEGKSISFRKTW